MLLPVFDIEGCNASGIALNDFLRWSRYSLNGKELSHATHSWAYLKLHFKDNTSELYFFGDKMLKLVHIPS